MVLALGFTFLWQLHLFLYQEFSDEEDGYIPTNICQSLDGNSFRVNYHPEQCDWACSYVCCHCCDDATSLGLGLPHLKSTFKPKGSPDDVNVNVCKSKLLDIGCDLTWKRKKSLPKIRDLGMKTFESVYLMGGGLSDAQQLSDVTATPSQWKFYNYRNILRVIFW